VSILSRMSIMLSSVKTAVWFLLILNMMIEIMTDSIKFLTKNAYFGELNIIARKKDFDSTPSPLKDDADEIFHIFKAAQKRDRLYSRLNLLRKKKRLGYPYRFIRRNFTKPQDVFRDYFNGNEVVADYQII